MNAGPFPVFSIVVSTVPSEVSDTQNVINKYLLTKPVTRKDLDRDRLFQIKVLFCSSTFHSLNEMLCLPENTRARKGKNV